MKRFFRLPVIIGSLPNTLTNGTTADATQVMADLNWIVNQVNANAAALSTVALINANNNFTVVQSGIAATQPANFPIASQVQNQVFNTLSSTLGTNTITARVSALPLTAYAVRQIFTFVPSQTNSGSATLNIDSVGAGAVQLYGSALTGGELFMGVPVSVLVTATTPTFEIIRAEQFVDSRPLIVGSANATKKLRFDVGNLTAGATRVVSVPDRNIALGPTLMGVVGASSTRVTFTGIPSGVKRVKIMLQGISTNGTDPLLVQIGGIAGLSGSTYISSAGSNLSANISSTVGFIITTANVAARAYYGTVTIELSDPGALIWNASGTLTDDAGSAFFFAGAIAIASELFQVSLTTSVSTNTFDAGTVNVSYE